MNLKNWMGTEKGQIRFEYGVIFVILLMIAGMIGLSGCEQAKGPAPSPEWTSMGRVDDGTGGASVYKRKDPDHANRTIYVAIGVNSCSVTVVESK